MQTVNDPTELLAASGAFGLLGVVVSITLQLDEMGVTNMMPVKVPMPLAIPPPKGYAIPYEVQKVIEDKKITDAQLADAQKEFERRCEQDYYLEWFWFPYQNDVWVNTWSSMCLVRYFTGNIKTSFLERPVTNSDVDVSAYPGDGLLDGVKSQQVPSSFRSTLFIRAHHVQTKVQATLAEALIDFTPFRWLSGRAQAFTLGSASLLALPDITDASKAIRTFQSEAEHFRRGIRTFISRIYTT